MAISHPDKKREEQHAESAKEDFIPFVAQNRLEALLNNATIVDLGGGFGHIVEMIRKQYPQIQTAICIDTDTAKVEIGKKIHPEILFYKNKITETELPTSSVDLVLSSHIIDFADTRKAWQSYSLLRLVNEVTRIGKNNAYYFCNDSLVPKEMEIMQSGLSVVSYKSRQSPVIFQVRK